MMPRNEKRNVLEHGAKVMGALLLGAALAAGCSAKPPEETPAANVQEQVKTIKITKATKQKIGEPDEQVADIVASVQMDVFAKVGSDVVEILKRRGDNVAAGETIIRLKQDDAVLNRQKAELGLRSAQSSFTRGQLDIPNTKAEMANNVAKAEQGVKDLLKAFNKMRNDYDQGLVTKTQLEDMEIKYNQAVRDVEILKSRQAALNATLSIDDYEIGLKQAQIGLEQATTNLDNYNIKAPISGLITELPLELGMQTQPGTRVLQVLQVDPVKIKADLTETAAESIRGKQELEFYVPGTVQRTKAKVTYLSKVMNPSTKSYQLELEVPNKDLKLKPGSKAQVLLGEDKEQIVVTIPTASVVREGSETFVFVYAGDTVEKRKVALGRLNETMQEVREGVKEGEQIVISGQHQLKDKEKVQLAK